VNDRPNVLLIITDQQRPDTMGFRGETPCRTPNIDRIASEGISFDRAITPCPLCLPSRASLFTGVYPTQNNMMDASVGYLDDCQMLDHFRGAGYQINYAGKWHMGEGNIGDFTDRHAGDSTLEYSKWCKDQGLIDGWMFNDPKTRTTRTPSMSIPKVHVQDIPVDKTNEAYVTDFAIDMLKTRDKDKPYFQVCSFNGPHPPFMIPEPYFSMYNLANVPKPDNFGPQVGELELNQTSFYRQLFLDHSDDFEDWRASFAVYWGFVTMIDDHIGRLLETLENEGLFENTVIIFTSDHGENLGSHGLWHKMVPYSQSVQVPLLLSVPNTALANIRTNAPASLIDLPPTLAAICGLENLPEWQGVDLLHELADPNTDRAVFSMQQPLGDWMKTTDWRMIERGNLKYVWYADGSEELFDLEKDRFETKNIIDNSAYRDKLRTLRTELGGFLARTDDPMLSTWIDQGLIDENH
jgi:arylsulfatase A-like enzyme